MIAPQGGPDLRDIHVPPPPSWWPPAPGWWVLAIVVIACGIVAIAAIYKKRKMRQQRLAIFAELDRCVASANGDQAAIAASLSKFVRRVSLRDSTTAAALAGESWLAYLDERAQTQDFSTGIGRALIEAPFQAAPSYDVAGLVALVRRWTRHVLGVSARA